MRAVAIRFSLLAALLFACPAAAGTVVTLPFTIDAASLGFDTNTIDYPLRPTSLPLVAVFGTSTCTNDQFTFIVEEIDDSLEVELEAIGTNLLNGECFANAVLEFDYSFDVPELGGTSTVVRFIPEILESGGTGLYSGSLVLDGGQGLTSSIFDLSTGVGIIGGNLFAVSFSPPAVAGPLDADATALPLILIPGDTVTGKMTIRAKIRGAISPGPAAIDASYRVRISIKTVVPEPSAALSIPIGVGALAGLSMLKGGG